MTDVAIKILDGGFSTELEKRGYSLNADPLWTARFLHSNPSAIVDVHKSFLATGCDIITTSSYQASVSGFQKYLGSTYEDAVQLIKLSVELALQARKESMKENPSALVAGSVGPYGAACADGSEYSGDYCEHLTHEELIEWHRVRVQCLVEAGVDLLAFETIPSQKEGEALMRLLHDFPGIKAWLSFSSQSLHRTCHGEDIRNAAKNCVKIAPPSQLIAIGVNCCPPSFTYSLLKDISQGVGEFPLIVYPNSGEKWVNKVGWTNNKEKPLCDYVEDWIGVNAKIIGGCCRTGAEDIAQIVEKVKHCRT